MESAILTGADEIRGRLLAYQAWVSVWTGDVAGAGESAAESASLVATEQATNWQAGQAAGSLALVRFAAGDPEGCLELMLRAGGGPELPTVRQVWQPMWFDTLSAAATAAGRHQDAAGWAKRAALLPADDTLSRRAALILLAQVHPLLHTRPEQAVPMAEQAARLFNRAGDRLGAARAQHYTASAYAEAGDAELAEREAERARLAFLKCGARPEWLFSRAQRREASRPALPTPPGRGEPTG
jgi:tetratricopeptide (TPR) repeat protein